LVTFDENDATNLSLANGGQRCRSGRREYETFLLNSRCPHLCRSYALPQIEQISFNRYAASNEGAAHKLKKRPRGPYA
jgi:hypothetical protein